MYNAAVHSAFRHSLVLLAWPSIPIWQWLALLLAVVLAIGIARVLRRIGVPLMRRRVGSLFAGRDEHLLDDLAAPMRALLLVGVIEITISLMEPAPAARRLWDATLSKLLIVLGVWLFTRAFRIIARFSGQYLERVGRVDSTALVRLIQRTLNAVALFLAVVLLFRSAGFDVTAMIAGLGVGGIAIAFAAQKTLENLFGGISIIFDKPIRVGDVCKIGAQEGRVEDIGLRSTRLRTNDRTVLTVPNGQLSTMNLENLAMRDKMWFRHTVGVSLETTRDQMERLMDGLRGLLAHHRMVEPFTARARFVRLGPASMEIELSAYILTTDGAQFLEIQEELLLGTLKVIEGSGTAVAIPDNAARLGPGPGPYAARGAVGGKTS